MSIATTVILEVDMPTSLIITPILMHTHMDGMAASKAVEHCTTIWIEGVCYIISEDVALHQYLEFTKFLHPHLFPAYSLSYRFVIPLVDPMER